MRVPNNKDTYFIILHKKYYGYSLERLENKKKDIHTSYLGDK